MTIQSTDPRSGLFRFLHHDTSLEWSENVDERLEYIRTKKPAQEIAGRLAAILRVPDEMIPLVLQEAGRACEEAGRAYEEAERAREEAWRAYNTIDFVLQFGPLPEGVTWNGKELIFACGQEEPPA